MNEEKWEIYGDPNREYESWESKYTFYELHTRKRVGLFTVWWNNFYCYPGENADFILYRIGDGFRVEVERALDDDEECSGFEEYDFESDYELAKWMLKRLYREEYGQCFYILCDFKEDV